MKKQLHPDEPRALAAGQRRARAAGLIGLGLGVVFVLIAGEFHAANCVLLITIAAMGGIMAGRSAGVIYPPAAGSAGRSSGTLAAFGFALPFVVFYAVQAATITEEIAAGLLAALGPDIATAIAQAGYTPGAAFFQQQYVSYIGAYVIFAALLGQVGGWVGGLIGRRSVENAATAAG